MDFLENENFVMNGNERAEFIEIVRRDSIFLMKQNLMDYSFLLIIAKDDQEKTFHNQNEKKDWKNYVMRENRISFSIIDFL